MPITKENQARYPVNWKEIRARILKRADNKCEWPGCGAPNGETILRRKDDLEQWRGLCSNDMIEEDTNYKPVMVCLTIAHLNHTPEDCSDENLKAWCQLHHLRYDSSHHVRNSSETRRTKNDSRRGLLEGAT